MTLTRRALLTGASATALLAACDPPDVQVSPSPLEGELGNAHLASRGHRIRQPLPASATTTSQDSAAVVIVGGGVAGLAAAWRLTRAGFTGRVVILELSDMVGGTSATGAHGTQRFPLGAHYITLPNPECRHMRALLHQLGVITAFTSAGQPRFRNTSLCFAPQERLYIGGAWQNGLWPATGAEPEDTAAYHDFQERCDHWTQRRGADGRPAFSIPVAHSSADPEILRLADISMADWMDARGYRSPRLRWYIEYACRDDYGTTLANTSAWAGLHYFCSRRPDAANRDLGTHVLTWPEGNGWLVKQLQARISAEIRTGALVRRIEPESGRLWYEQADSVHRLDADHIIAAVPARVADRLVERPAHPRPTLAPWRVAQLFCSELPKTHGVPFSWDSVIYGAQGLGYVSNRHQTARSRGPSVLTWYQPLDHTATPAEARHSLVRASWAEGVDTVLSELAPAHPNLRSVLSRIDIYHWGHGTARPVVGLHSGALLAQAAAPVGRVHFAHSDLSGISLFEEASWHGVRAAEELLTQHGPLTESLL